MKNGTTEEVIHCGAEMPPTEARDWGRKEYQEELLEYIDTAVGELDEKDIEGHLWWAKFKNLVNKVKP